MALLFGGTVLLFSRAVGYGFLNYDDPRYVAANPHIQAPIDWSTLGWAFTARTELWQPLTWITHMLDWQLYGENAAGHHLTNVLWHALNAVLAFVVFQRLTRTFWTSALAAALFAWHPLRVESVAWIAERKDVLSGTFFLLTIWAYLEYAELRRRGATESNRNSPPIGAPQSSVPTNTGQRETYRTSTSFYVLTLALFAAGLMCKPTLVTLPLLLLAFDFWPLRRAPEATRAGNVDDAVSDAPQAPRAKDSWHQLVVEKLPFLVLSIAIGVITVRLQKSAGDFTINLPLGARLANAPVAMVRYLGKFFWPANLSVAYPHPGWWPAGVVIGAVVVVAAITLAVWRWRHVTPWAATGWVWFIALLLPTIGIVQVGFQSMADRYTYLPTLGWELACLWTLRTFCGSTVIRRIAAVAVVAILAAAAARTWQQQAAWHDSETLFRRAITASGSSAVSESMLGYTLAAEGKVDEAVQHCERALALDASNEMAVYTLAGLRASQGRIEEAIAGYRRSLELQPNDAGTEFQLALQLIRHGDLAEARTTLENAARQNKAIVERNRALAADEAHAGHLPAAALHYVAATMLEPDNARAYYDAGAALVRLGNDRDAETNLTRAVALAPDLVDAQVELGLLLLNHRRPEAAVPHFRAALARDPSLPAANAGLGRAEEALGERSEADAAFQRALATAPDDAGIARAWADILARRRQFSDAVGFYRRAVALQPTDAANHAGLGYVLFLTGRRNEAVAAWREALRLNPNFPGLRERLQRLGETEGR